MEGCGLFEPENLDMFCLEKPYCSDEFQMTLFEESFNYQESPRQEDMTQEE